MAGPVLARSDWSVVHPAWSYLNIPTAEAFQHHTGGDSPGTDLIGYLRDLEYGEMNRGDGLIALAYHWMVVSGGPHDGTKVEVRPWGMQGGATLNHNAVSHAVCMTGNFQTAVPTEAAMDSCAEVWAEGMRRGFVSVAAMIQPHSSVFATACPGTNLRALLPNLRTRSDNKLAPPKPKVAPMYDPPLQIVAELQNPQGGRWQAHPHGKVDYIYPDGHKIEGGMISANDRRAFVGRSVAQLEIRWYRKGLFRKAGYTIVATSGERYVPETQH